jgi:aspartate kinase
MIVQSTGEDGMTNMTFTTGKGDLERTIAIMEAARPTIQYGQLMTDSDVVKISVVGIGMRSHAGIASTMFKTLADRAINVQVISTSEIKVSVLIGAEYAELAIRALHTAYGLDAA